MWALANTTLGSEFSSNIYYLHCNRLTTFTIWVAVWRAGEVEQDVNIGRCGEVTRAPLQPLKSRNVVPTYVPNFVQNHMITVRCAFGPVALR